MEAIRRIHRILGNYKPHSRLGLVPYLIFESQDLRSGPSNLSLKMLEIVSYHYYIYMSLEVISKIEKLRIYSCVSENTLYKMFTC